MAQRRMFSKEITTSDTFVDMPMSSQLLYFHLGMEADDEGFIGNAKMLSRAYGANSDDLSLLKAKGFIIMFETGVSVVKDWNLNNKIRKDRVKPTIYRSEKSLLNVDIDGAYYVDNQMATKRQPIDNQMSAQDRLGKDRLGKDRKDILSGSDEPDRIPYKEIVDYLNKKTGSKYRSSGSKTKTLIKARVHDGFELKDFKQVIDIKTEQWLSDQKMNKFLRPETLFGTKFEGYLNENKSTRQPLTDDDWTRSSIQTTTDEDWR
ncbi:DNA replication protein [Leuconostoc pseudomesenteroides]|uniref:conserved phage C-terminal domain-containing protein n=1 Tax=Leuconostoc pseudomesenteroides TaxID=33968 RepID=UPI00111EC318|nr:conserved phage C-terminal domain-containing protein [Leuconostoc pseudomesenteroides]MCC8439891.1 DNA replication protein [Leuconostoc pseudomesenteroides]TOZ02085.1 DNA replication protein [Leuconostoc pseudomesenteroides]